MATFGIEYGYEGQVDPSIASKYTSIGAKTTKFSDVNWGDIEPTKPFKFFTFVSHNYQWAKLDSFVKAWQAIGYSEFNFVLRSKCTWGTKATIPITPELSVYQNLASCPPTPDNVANYTAFVKEIVSRYSGKVPSKTMPGLLYPVKYWEIESEAGSPMFWLGTKDDYSNMLKIAYTTIKSVDPSAVVILSGINLNDMMKTNPTEQQIYDLINTKPEPWKSFLLAGIDFFRDNLRYPKYFDVIEFHSLHDYESVPYIVNLINRECDKAGCPRKEIWMGDAMSAPHSHPSPVDFYPISEPAASYNYIMWWPDNPQYAAADAWFLKEQSKLAIKRMVIGAGCNCKKIYMGTLIDWPWYSGYPYNGLIETDGSKRPVYVAMSFFISALSTYTSASYSYEDGVYKVRFDMPDGRVCWVCWSDTITKVVSLSFNFDSVVVKKIIETDYTITKVESANIVNKQLFVTVTDVPLIVVQ